MLASVGRTSRLVVVEENPYQGGWGGTVVSIVADEGFELLDAPIRRVAAASVPLPFADALEERGHPHRRQGGRRRPPARRLLKPPPSATHEGIVMSNRMLLRGGHVLTMDPDVGDLPQGDVLIEDDKIVAVEPDDRRRRRGRRRRPAASSSPASSTPTGTPGRRRSAAARPTPPWTTTSSRCSTRSRPLYRPEDVYASNLAGSLECLNAGITTLVDWSHINNTPGAPGRRRSAALQETGIRAQYAYGSANTSLADYWFESKIAIPGDDVRRIRDTYFSSDDGLLTMALATRGPGFCNDDVVRAEWALARELGIPITVHVAMGRLAGRFGMVKQLDRPGPARPGHHVHPLLLLQRRGVAAGRRHRRHDLDRAAGRDADGPRLAAGR